MKLARRPLNASICLRCQLAIRKTWKQQTQLFHIHNFGSELRATVFVGVNTLQPLIMSAREVSPGLRKTVSTSSGGHATKQVKFPICTAADVVEFMELVRVKLEYAGG